MQRPSYRRPPLQEVICEVFVSQDTPWDLALPGILYERLKDKFPIRERRFIQDAEIQLSSTGSALNIRQGERAVFLAQDRRRLVQVGERLVVINQLPPYPGWQAYKQSIEEAYQALKETAEMKSFQRIALRYIDRIEIPGTKIKTEEYFRFRPHFEGIQEESPLNLWVGFIVGIQIPYDEQRDLLRLQMGVGPPQKDKVTFILETEYLLARPETIGPNNIYEWLDLAHGRVVEAFESAITDKLRALFEPS